MIPHQVIFWVAVCYFKHNVPADYPKKKHSTGKKLASLESDWISIFNQTGAAAMEKKMFEPKPLANYSDASAIFHLSKQMQHFFRLRFSSL